MGKKGGRSSGRNGSPGSSMNPNFRNFALWAIIALLLIALFSMFQTAPSQTSSREVSYSQFLKDVDSGRVRDVVVTGNRVMGTLAENGQSFQTYSPVIDDSLMSRLQEKNVNIVARPETDGSSGFLSYLGTCAANVAHPGRLVVLHAPDAGWIARCDGLRQVQGQASDRGAWPRDV